VPVIDRINCFFPPPALQVGDDDVYARAFLLPEP